ncbi:hypothetical protein A9Q98_08600 [Thalassotalea sp. 42_200_T64]|nr:hypothetical protein A9Q98_08600 [Thalassotalea sp. 42_200_T64]
MNQWINNTSDNSKPFFVQFISNSPHQPFTLPGNFQSVLLTDYDELTVNDKAYYKALHFVDNALGSLIEQLKTNNLYQKTIFAITGDHALERMLLKESTLKNFLMISAPGAITQSVISKRSIDHGDILPTLASIAGNNNFGDYKTRNVLTENFQTKIQYFFESNAQPHYWGLKDGQYKYLEQGYNQEKHLYDLNIDPDLQHNLALRDEFKQQTEHYAKLTKSWYIQKHNDFLTLFEQKPLVKENAQLYNNHQGLAKLKVGYLEQRHTAEENRSPIIFTEANTFNPQAQVAINIRWLNPKPNETFDVYWKGPKSSFGKVHQQFKQSLTIDKNQSGILTRLFHQQPLTIGQWTITIKQNTRLLGSYSFLIDQFTTLPANSTNINRLKSVNVGLINDSTGFTPKNTLDSTDRIDIQTIWFCEDRFQRFTLVLVSPNGEGFPFELKVSPGICDRYKKLTPPQALQRGTWQVVILAGEQILGSKEFTVQ